MKLLERVRFTWIKRSERQAAGGPRAKTKIPENVRNVRVNYPLPGSGAGRFSSYADTKSAAKKNPGGSLRRGFRSVAFARDQLAICASAARSSSATMLVILIIGLTAGPAVSL